MNLLLNRSSVTNNKVELEMKQSYSVKCGSEFHNLIVLNKKVDKDFKHTTFLHPCILHHCIVSNYCLL
jgi:hypothetical protein